MTTAVAAKAPVRTATKGRSSLGDAWHHPITRAVVKAFLTV
jgi:hypothetical protein